jgi:hypothetical protein
MTALEILKKARALVAEGWCQGQGIAVCDGAVYKRDIVNALNDAAGGVGGMASIGGPEEREAFRLMWDVTGGAGIIRFNDDPHTTLSHVLWAFDVCISDLEPAAVKSE